VRIAILSDIHGNLEALARVCEHAGAHGAERYACLGDFVGYGADPGPTLARVMALPGLIAVRGNHDEALFQEDMTGGTYPDVLASISWARARLTAAQREFLADLPLLVRDGVATYAHASAHRPDAWEYLCQPEQIQACLEAAGTPVTFIGHVHVPRVFYETAGGAVRELEPRDGTAIPLSAGARYVVNVGSVGQPRDGNNAACYALYDEAAQEVTFHRLAYDYGATAAKIRAAGLSPFFAERLAYGR
jgi:diadenosine tetraphosphatase ApaH/serine/threonine PP2A family protein phosphatase